MVGGPPGWFKGDELAIGNTSWLQLVVAFSPGT